MWSAELLGIQEQEKQEKELDEYIPFVNLPPGYMQERKKNRHLVQRLDEFKVKKKRKKSRDQIEESERAKAKAKFWKHQSNSSHSHCSLSSI